MLFSEAERASSFSASPKKGEIYFILLLENLGSINERDSGLSHLIYFNPVTVAS